MKLKEKSNFTIKRMLTLLTILFTFLTTGSNTFQIKILNSNLTQTKTQNKNNLITTLENEIFLEKSSSLKKKNTKKSKNSKKKSEKTKGKEKETEKWPGGTLNNPPVAATDKPQFKNDTLSRAMYRDINNTFVSQKINPFLLNQRKWDWKLLDKQLQEIAFDMNYQEDYGRTPEALRAFIKYFINFFEACDKDQDKQLSRVEFQVCLTNDTNLALIIVPSSDYAALSAEPAFNYTNATQFANNLFDLLDEQESNFLNFHSYMRLRLFVFSWRRCSVAAPFIEEANFECAIEIAAGWKTLSRSQARILFFLALQLSGNEALRNLDFLTFVSFAQATRLYGKINGKEDNDITRAEFNLALDNNILPLRYNQDVIGFFFKLVEDSDRPNQGVDLLSFCFYDFWLKIFKMSESSRKFYLTLSEYLGVFSSPLYPKIMKDELAKIPQNNLTSAAYQMYMYLNISNYQDESDHFLKSFLETSATVKSQNAKANAEANEKLNLKWSINEASNNLSSFAFRLNETMQNIFKIIDANSDGFITFYDFGSLMQINFLFSKFDNFEKGRIVSGDLYDNYTSYSDFPMVSYLIKERAKKFRLFPQDLYADLFSVILTLKIEDLVSVFARKADKTTLFEVELKNIFALANRKFVPDAYLNRCLRGVNADNVPLYDWECAYVQSETRTLTFYENSFDRLTAAANNINLFNTVFYNIEANLPQQGAIPGELGNGGNGAGSGAAGSGAGAGAGSGSGTSAGGSAGAEAPPASKVKGY